MGATGSHARGLAPAAHQALTFALGDMAAGPMYERHPGLPLELAATLGIVLIPVLVFAQRHASRLHGG